MTTTQDRFLTEFDIHLLSEGTHYRTYEKLGAHMGTLDGKPGTFFAVWAPNAKEVSVIGDFNDWTRGQHPMSLDNAAGIWQAFVPGVKQGALYKYAIQSKVNGYYV